MIYQSMQIKMARVIATAGLAWFAYWMIAAYHVNSTRRAYSGILLKRGFRLTMDAPMLKQTDVPRRIKITGMPIATGYWSGSAWNLNPFGCCTLPEAALQ